MRYTRSDWLPRAGSKEFLADMSRAIRSAGYFILENVIDPKLVGALREAFDEELKVYLGSNDANRGVNRFNTHLHLKGVFASEEVVANPVILPLVYDILGIDAACTWAAADTPLPGSDYQIAHADGRPLFRKHDLSLPTYAVTANIPLVDFTEENGPLEIWPHGTHLIPDVPASIGANDRAPERVIVPAGSLIVRDTRVWHRGSPNLGSEARPNLAFVYNRSWYRFEGEAGHVPPSVDPDAYAAWGEQAQKLFRFAALDPAITQKWRTELVYRVEELEALAAGDAPARTYAAF